MMIEKELSKISKEIFSSMRAGKHYSSSDGELYFLIEKYESELSEIFSAVGFELIINTLGFAYLNGHSDNLVNKKTIQKEAAFYFIFVQWLLEDGKNPTQCIKEQHIYSMNSLPHLSSGSNLDIMKAVETTNDGSKFSFEGIEQRGFINLKSDSFNLLAPSLRYIDLCYKIESVGRGEEE